MANDGATGQQPITLAITLTPDGRISITGPTNDPILCYGLLELAKDGLRRLNAPRVVRPEGALPPEFQRRA